MGLVRHPDVADPEGGPAAHIAASYLGSGYRKSGRYPIV